MGIKQTVRNIVESLYSFVPFKPFFSECWSGEMPLWKAFWVAYFTPRVISVILFGFILLVSGTYWYAVTSVYIAIVVLVYAWGWHVLWRNAPNTFYPVYTFISRGIVVAEFLTILWLAY